MLTDLYMPEYKGRKCWFLTSCYDICVNNAYAGRTKKPPWDIKVTS